MTQLSQPEDKGTLSVTKAILIGHLIISIPVIVIVFGFTYIGRMYFGRQWWIPFIIGFLLSWLWWSYVVPRWRRWAVQRGAPADKLHRIAVATGLEWEKGVIFEKTEIKVKDGKK